MQRHWSSALDACAAHVQNRQLGVSAALAVGSAADIRDCMARVAARYGSLWSLFEWSVMAKPRSDGLSARLAWCLLFGALECFIAEEPIGCCELPAPDYEPMETIQSGRGSSTSPFWAAPTALRTPNTGVYDALGARRPRGGRPTRPLLALGGRIEGKACGRPPQTSRSGVCLARILRGQMCLCCFRVPL